MAGFCFTRQIRSVELANQLCPGDSAEVSPAWLPSTDLTWFFSEITNLPRSPTGKSQETLSSAWWNHILRERTRGRAWMLREVMSPPFIATVRCDGKSAIPGIESFNVYGKHLFTWYMAFKSVDHCFGVLEGTLGLILKAGEE
ncbi:hypothetical protein FQN55_009068 [Onygenales sp. PD_40]|nr:hypothetical protein FQN55_009068 [Onygenales sp. PD_40]